MSDSNPRGEWVRQPVDSCAVVFVHGLLSSSETCWRAGEIYWPELLAEETDFTNVGIYVFGYRTGVFTGRYNTDDAVEALKTYLELDGLLNLKKLIFVCHSMGGILVRQFLLTRQVMLIERSMHIGLFLIASPSLGSDYANLLKLIVRAVGQAQADILRSSHDNYWLNALDQNFRNLKESGVLALEGKELVEDQFIILPGLFRKQVVQPFQAAKYFGDPLKIPGSNHFTIAAPTGRDSLQHRLLKHFIVGFLKTKNTSGRFAAPAPIEPKLTLKLLEPEGSRITIPAIRNKKVDVKARLEAIAARVGAPGMDWACKTSQPLRDRHFDRVTAENRALLGRPSKPLSTAANTPLEEYAEAIWAWYKVSADTYLYDHDYLTIALRMFVVAFAVQNEGNAPADGVKVYLTFPQNLKIGGIPYPDFRTNEPLTYPDSVPHSLKAEIDKVLREQEVSDDSWYEQPPIPNFVDRLTKSPGLKLFSDNSCAPQQLRTLEIGLKEGQSQAICPITLDFDGQKAFNIVVPFRLHASNQPNDSVGEIEITVTESTANPANSAA
jgi:pimeloyl-ACP methyl ester carboxylesterase